jgi:hypothetical protein
MVLALRRGDGRAADIPLHSTDSARNPVDASALRVKLLGAGREGEVEGVDELPGRANYFIGNDPTKWRRDVPSFARVRCRGVYPGIDLVYRGREKELEYDFVVWPGGDPRRIRLGFEGQRSLRLDASGNLVVALGREEVVHHAPLLYQQMASERRPVRGRWVLHAKDTAGFEVEAYDTSHALVIDPVLAYSTYLGGSSAEWGFGLAVDAAGSAYLTGYTTSLDFPTQDPYQALPGGQDAFVTKLSPSGNAIVYSTYLGGSSADVAQAIAVDGSGSAYVMGITSSTDFPTQDPFQTDQAVVDTFVTKLSPSGNGLAYSTYLGGGGNDLGRGIAVDGSGSAYVTGSTTSTDFPTLNPYQTDQVSNDVFVTKLSPAGNGLVYSTYLGGDDLDYGYGIAVDASGSAYVTGYTVSTDFPTLNPYQTDQPSHDAFVTKMSPAGSGLVYSTYLGGNDVDIGNGIAVDRLGSAYVTGDTASTDFPTQNPYQTDQPAGDVFVTKLSPSGNGLAYSTYLGGSAGEGGAGIAVDGAGGAYITGNTASTDFPTRNAYQTDQAVEDVIVTKLSPSGSGLVYSTYLGGNDRDYGNGIAVDGLGNAYVTGRTDSADFPTQGPYQPDQPGQDLFVTKLRPPPMAFFALSPCRSIDTRNAVGPYGGPALSAGANRIFTVAGSCSLPQTARAISVNIAVTGPSAAGYLRLYPAESASPPVASINYASGQTRANNAVVPLDTSGALAVFCSQASGTVHLIVDVTGYFE